MFHACFMLKREIIYIEKVAKGNLHVTQHSSNITYSGLQLNCTSPYSPHNFNGVRAKNQSVIYIPSDLHVFYLVYPFVVVVSDVLFPMITHNDTNHTWWYVNWLKNVRICKNNFCTILTLDSFLLRHSISFFKALIPEEIKNHVISYLTLKKFKCTCWFRCWFIW